LQDIKIIHNFTYFYNCQKEKGGDLPEMLYSLFLMVPPTGIEPMTKGLGNLLFTQ